MLAGALLDAKRFDEAGVEYRKLADAASERSARLVWPRHELPGRCRERLRATAEDRCRRRRTSPRLVADTRVQRRQYRSAFFFYNEALKQLPNLHGIHAALADVYRKTGHPDWAAEEDAKERALPAADCKAHPAECQFAGGPRRADSRRCRAARRLSPEALYWQAKAANELAMQAFFRLGQLPPSVELHQFARRSRAIRASICESAREWRAALALCPAIRGCEREMAVSLFLAQDYRAALEEAERC